MHELLSLQGRDKCRLGQAQARLDVNMLPDDRSNSQYLDITCHGLDIGVTVPVHATPLQPSPAGRLRTYAWVTPCWTLF
jgi:hypothetical protein